MNNLSVLCKLLGKYAEVEHLATKALETRRRVLGDEDLDTLGNFDDLVALRQSQAKYAEADWLRLSVPARIRRHGQSARTRRIQSFLEIDRARAFLMPPNRSRSSVSFGALILNQTGKQSFSPCESVVSPKCCPAKTK